MVFIVATSQNGGNTRKQLAESLHSHLVVSVGRKKNYIQNDSLNRCKIIISYFSFFFKQRSIVKAREIAKKSIGISNKPNHIIHNLEKNNAVFIVI